MRLLEYAPFTWGLAGGYAIEQFVGQPIRSHGDIDVLVFRDNQLRYFCCSNRKTVVRRMMPIFKHA